MPSSKGTGNTSGAGTPCYIQVSGTGITAAGVDLTTQDNEENYSVSETANGSFGAVGQGHGAIPGVAGSSQPNAQYALTLSLSGATYDGVAYSTSTEAIAVLVDVLNNSVSDSEYVATDFVWQAWGSPAPDTLGYLKRSNNFTPVVTNSPQGKNPPAYPSVASPTGTLTAATPVVTLSTPSGYYDADVVITASAVGKCTVEVAYPVFDNDLGDNDGYSAPDTAPVMAIVARIDVTVVA